MRLPTSTPGSRSGMDVGDVRDQGVTVTFTTPSSWLEKSG